MSLMSNAAVIMITAAKGLNDPFHGDGKVLSTILMIFYGFQFETIQLIFPKILIQHRLILYEGVFWHTFQLYEMIFLLSISLFISLSLLLSSCLPVYLTNNFSLSGCRNMYLFPCLPLSVSVPACLSVYPFARLAVLSVYSVTHYCRYKVRGNKYLKNRIQSEFPQTKHAFRFLVEKHVIYV